VTSILVGDPIAGVTVTLYTSTLKYEMNDAQENIGMVCVILSSSSGARIKVWSRDKWLRDKWLRDKWLRDKWLRDKWSRDKWSRDKNEQLTEGQNLPNFPKV
jgi:hypothetical protein